MKQGSFLPDVSSVPDRLNQTLFPHNWQNPPRKSHENRTPTTSLRLHLVGALYGTCSLLLDQ